MKISGNCIVGDHIQVDRFTAKWASIKVLPITYYRKQEEITKILDSCTGICAELDNGEHVSIRFSEKSDLENFYKQIA
jgi:hypothetical protein